jgi:BirA family biotin operon repressor/biotin-[acetyl-CoA-carboxylase] ligase
MPAEFDLASVEHGLLGTRFAGQVKHFASVGSTSQLALDAAQRGERGGVWVAGEQTAGRGRGGHQWHSAPGDGLYVSALVTPRVSVSEGTKIPLATGLAAQAAVLEATGLTIDIRWPNDLMFGDRKCGGILVESGSEAGTEQLRFAVIGIGINVRHAAFPDELSRVATSLFLESGRRFDREPLLASLLRRLDGELSLLESDRSPLGRFAAASSWVSGKRVRVGDQDGYTGWTRGLDRNGFLRVEDDLGVMRTVLSGGVRSA